MKIYTKALFLAVSALFFAGCALISSYTDGGVFRSDDGGKNFAQKVAIDEKTKISSVDVLSLAVNPHNGNEVFIGTKSAGIFKTTDAGEKWQPVKISDKLPSKVYAIAIDPINPAMVYAAAIVDGRGKILKSGDAGATWKEIYSEASSGPFVLALALDPIDPKRIFAGTTKGQIIFSDNGGDTWKNLYQARSEVFKIAIDFFDPNLVYFAVNQNGLLRTRDGGKNFEELAEKNIVNRETGLERPSALITDPTRANWVYAGTDVGLFRSKDGGENWELIKTLNRPRENAVRGMAVNPTNSDEIVYGAAQAFYKSVDGGQSWAITQFGGSRTVEVVAYNGQNAGVIYVGMNKR
jgi:photosystem II stability/assembly factor-like uncharacterized protein